MSEFQEEMYKKIVSKTTSGESEDERKPGFQLPQRQSSNFVFPSKNIATSYGNRGFDAYVKEEKIKKSKKKYVFKDESFKREIVKNLGNTHASLARSSTL